MKFDDLDAKMRVFETAHDHCVLPGIWIVVRLDGRSFTKLTKETHKFDSPFDARMRDNMVETMRHVMECGFHTVYGFTQSDEISILFHRDADGFGRKERKIISVMAGEASAHFALRLGSAAAFDARVSQLPSAELVRDYFRWRQEDAGRNALSAHCYWAQRREGTSAKRATSTLLRMTTAQKNEFLFQRGINFNDLPLWQKRGVGARWVMKTKRGRDPRTGVSTSYERRDLETLLELDRGDAYGRFIEGLAAE